MKSLHDIISPVGAALVAALQSSQVYHYWRPRLEAPYCIWAEDGEATSLEANDRKAEQAVSGYVDYYTRAENDPAVGLIQTALNGISGVFAWRLDSVQYEDETNLLHYQWLWEAG